MHIYDVNARRQIVREHVDALARDARRAPDAPARRPQPEHAEDARVAALVNRLRRRRPARTAAQRP